jgi:hypothetical protein
VSTLIVLAVIEILGLAGILFYVRSRLHRALELDGLLESLRKEVRALTIELNETADRNISLVEDRILALRSLLEESDKRLEVVQRELARRDQEAEVYSRLGRPRPAEAPLPQRPAPAEALAQAQAEAQAQASREPIRLDLSRRNPEIASLKESVIPPKSKREEALELWAKGFSADIIAARLGSTVAEIDLLISLEEERRLGEGR